MGCDIHFFVERKEDGIWKSCDTWVEEDGYCYNRDSDRYYSDRNYHLFAILADVRNYLRCVIGDSDEKFTPIAEPKGFPEDASREVASYYNDSHFAGDLHSPTWYTLKELEDFDWNKQAPKPYPEGKTYGELCSHFRESVIGEMRNLSNGDPESVRCVVMFDN